MAGQLVTGQMVRNRYTGALATVTDAWLHQGQPYVEVMYEGQHYTMSGLARAFLAIADVGDAHDLSAMVLQTFDSLAHDLAALAAIGAVTPWEYDAIKRQLDSCVHGMHVRATNPGTDQPERQSNDS